MVYANSDAIYVSRGCFKKKSEKESSHCVVASLQTLDGDSGLLLWDTHVWTVAKQCVHKASALLHAVVEPEVLITWNSALSFAHSGQNSIENTYHKKVYICR